MNSPENESTPSKDEGQSSLRPGRTMFGRYRLERQLGGGGMAVVWLAHDERLNRPVALKFLSDTLFQNLVARENMKKETRHSLELTHPNIVRIYDFLEDDEAAAIAMEYVEGATLSQLRENRPLGCFEVAELRGWVAELCGALDYAHHEVGVVHRDLKPSNILITSRGSVKIADFGLSRQLHHPTTQAAWGETSGTLCYMSPQQLAGEVASESDDIYALGATLYELLTGKPPFILGDIASQIRTVTPEKMAARRERLSTTGETIPEMWEDTIAACLAKHPSGRPSSAWEIACFLGIHIERPFYQTERSVFRPVEVPTTSKLAAHLLQEEMERPTTHTWPEARSVAIRVSSPPSTSPDRQLERVALSRKLFLVSVGSAALPLILAMCMMLPGQHGPILAKIAPRANALPITAPGKSSPREDAGALIALNKPLALSLEVATSPQIPFHILPADFGKPSLESGESRENSTNADRLQSAQTDQARNTTVVQDLPHGLVRIESRPPGAVIYEGNTFLGIAPVTIPASPGRHVFVAAMDGSRTVSHTVDMAADQTKDIQFNINAPSASRASHEIAHHRHRPRKHAEPPMLAKIGRSIKETLMKAEAVIFPRPGKDGRLWD